MATVMKFSDIGKTANDLLNKDFPVGIIRVEGKGSEKVTSKVVSKFNFLGTRDTTTGGLTGEVKNTLTCLYTPPCLASKDGKEKPANPPLLIEAITTLGVAGSLQQSLEIKDAVLKGLNLSTTGSLSPAGLVNVKVGVDYAATMSRKCSLASNSSVDVMKGPIVTQESAIRCGDFLVGGSVAYNVNKAKLESYSAAVGFDLSAHKITLHGTNGMNTLTAAFYQKFSSGVETAYKAIWNKKSATFASTPASNGGFLVEVIAKFPLEPGSFLKTKLDNTGRLGISYSSLINSKVAVILAGSFDTMKAAAAEEGSRIGCGLVIDV